jgi:methyl-accepting chemotaxis protein
VLGKNSAMVFSICVDDHGYAPCHNLKFSRPLTGDPAIDMVQNRTKRIFDDKTGLKAATNKAAFLLQTYMRDTGEIMNDLSTPIMIGGRHWGAVRIGYKVSE